MTKDKFAVCRGGVFAIEEEATGKLWGISPKEKYAEERATRIAQTMGRNMCVCHYDKDNNRTVVVTITVVEKEEW